MWILASVAWSDDPTLTVRRILSFGLFVLGAIGLASHLRPLWLARFGAMASSVYLVVGVMALGHVSFAFSPGLPRISSAENPRALPAIRSITPSWRKQALQ